MNCIFNQETFEYVCPECDLAINDSRIADDSYYTHIFMDYYRGRVEPKLKKKLRRQWKRVQMIEHYYKRWY